MKYKECTFINCTLFLWLKVEHTSSYNIELGYTGVKFVYTPTKGGYYMCTKEIVWSKQPTSKWNTDRYHNTYKFKVSAMDYQVSSFIFPCFPLIPIPFIFPNNRSSNFITSSIRIISSSLVQLAPRFLFPAVINPSISFSAILQRNNKQTTGILLRTNIT